MCNIIEEEDENGVASFQRECREKETVAREIDDNLAVGEDISQMLAALITASSGSVPDLYLLYLQNRIKRANF